MRFLICSVEPPKLAFAKLAADEYLRRLRAYGDVELRSVRTGSAAEESARLLKASEKCRRILLDEGGSLLTTTDWKARFEKWDLEGTRDLAFLIGGAEGHGPIIRTGADEVWSLSPLTLQHELALVVLLEQIYRVQSWRRSEPYHREGARS
jgi:23S rRNA (pseudouridine1915-N3)-methyltransferase